MSEKIELHVVQEMPVGYGNRGIDGRPKYGTLGGTRRIRVSSQAWRRAMRSYLLEKLAKADGTHGTYSVRTRRLPREIADALVKSGMGKDDALLLARAAVAAGMHVDRNNKPNSGTNQLTAKVADDDDADLTSTMLVFSKDAPQEIADAIRSALDADPSFLDTAAAWNEARKAYRAAEEAARTPRGRRASREDEAEAGAEAEAGGEAGEADSPADTPKGRKPARGEAVPEPPDPIVPDVVRDAVRKSLHETGVAIDVALLGRFVAVLPDAKVDGSVQVAHALGTGANGEISDFFVAVDDLVRADEAAVAHVGSDRVLSGGTLYRHMVLDLDQLRRNVEAEGEEATEAVVDVAAGLVLHAFLASTPRAGSTGSAPQTIPYVVLAGVGDFHANMVGVFGSPIVGSDAADRLCRAWETNRVGMFGPRFSAGWTGTMGVALPEGITACATADAVVDSALKEAFGRPVSDWKISS